MTTKVNKALDVLYEDAMMGKAVQEFAKNHPGKKMEIRTTVEVFVSDNPSCKVIGQYPGYILKSEWKRTIQK